MMMMTRLRCSPLICCGMNNMLLHLLFALLSLSFVFMSLSSSYAVEAASTTSSTSSSSSSSKATKDLIEWIESKDDGYYNPKQEQRIIGTTNGGKESKSKSISKTKKNGIYATEIIEEGEILLSIPWKSIIGHSEYDAIRAKGDNDNDDNDNDNDGQDDAIKKECRAVDALLSETKLGSLSEFSTHLRYLNLLNNDNDNDNYDYDNDNDNDNDDNNGSGRNRNMIPTVWSQEGKDLLEDIMMGGELPPMGMFTLLNHDKYGQCILDSIDKYNDPIVQKVTQIIISSSSSSSSSQYGTKYGLIIPFMDNNYYNHGRIPIVNTVGKISFGTKFELIATRTIKKDEQIVRSYNDDGEKKKRKVSDNDDDDDDNEDDNEYYIDNNDIGTPELFRDYGIIEDYPQLYHFDLEDYEYGNIISIQIDKYWYEETDNELFEISTPLLTKDEDDVIDWENHILPYIIQQLYDLNKLKRIIIGDNDGDNDGVKPEDSTMTQYEWDTAWEYHTALITVMENILKYIREDDDKDDEGKEYCPGGMERSDLRGNCPIWDGGYDHLGDSTPMDDIDLVFNEFNPYGPSDDSYAMCNDDDVGEWDAYISVWDTEDEKISSIKSHYQEILFFEHPITKDMCMKLDDTVQQCTSYRPHYHEFAVHFPSRFINTIKRVLFVGGGDSMVLHDVLKYPSLELVVGLELDQFVLRNSFRYFHTQPHFDDKRVEWWFGDGAKSLLMLPKSYFGSFDLVVVDLSETVMSFQVTDKLSIFQTLSLLLQPEGIMLKNGEYYMEKMSQHFDYTLQYFEYDVPFICDQGMVIGSNNINFFNHSMKDHGVETLVYEPQEDILDSHDNPFYRFTEYRKNNAREQGQCDMDDSDIDVVGKQAGILMIVEAENLTTTKMTTTTSEESLLSALKKVGLTPISTVSSSASETFSTIVIIMEEGYITARNWPDKSYCALDIQLWGSFQLMEDTKDALVKVLGGTDSSTSSFRIVDGGMHGSSTMENDRKIIGPRIVHSRNCGDDDDDDENDTVSTTNDDAATDTEVIVLNESLHLLEDDVVAVVVCGVEGDPCKSLDVLRESSNKNGGKIKKIIPLWTCASIVESSSLFSQDISTKMTNCEVDISNTLSNDAGSEKVSLLVVDNSAQEVTLAILLSIFGSVWNRKRLFASHRFAIIVPTTSDEENYKAWRRNFLVLIREKITYRPLSLANLVIKKKSTGGVSSTPVHTMSVLSIHDSKFFLHLNEMISNFNGHTTTADIMEVESIYDGLPPPQVGPFRPKIFTPDDYDLQGGKEQLAAQKSMGRQSLYQFEISNSNSVPASALKTALEHSISEMEWDLIKDVQYFADGIGDGIVVVGIFSGGNVVTVWDGNSHIDVNLFSLDESEDLRYKFSTVFTKFLRKEVARKITLALSDTHPRGTGRVVSFPVGN